MTLWSEWFRIELLADVALAALLIEGIVLAVRALRGRPAPPLRALVAMLLPGALLLLALRAAATDTGAPWVAGYLAAALFAHLADLHERHRSPLDPSATTPPSGGQA